VVLLFVARNTLYRYIKNDKLPFARWANDKLIKENFLGFRFPFEIAAYICIYMLPFLYIYTVCGKRKTKVSFPWSANDKWLLTFVVSANVPIYGYFALWSSIRFGSVRRHVMWELHVEMGVVWGAHRDAGTPCYMGVRLWGTVQALYEGWYSSCKLLNKQIFTINSYFRKTKHILVLKIISLFITTADPHAQRCLNCIGATVKILQPNTFWSEYFNATFIIKNGQMTSL
jgi:hypothetical protein